MSRISLCHYCARKVILASVKVSTLLLIGSEVFGQSYPGLPSPERSDLQVSDPIQIRVTKQRNAGSNVVTLQEIQHVVPSKAWKEMEKAEAARLKNRTDDAISHYLQAIALDPEFVAARNNLAVVYFTTGIGDPGISQLEAAIKTDPHRPTVFTNLALGYTLIHQYEPAERAARVAVSLDRADARPRLILGIALVAQQKSTAEALQNFEEAGGTYQEAHLFAARVLMTEGQLKRAKSEIQIYLSSAEQENRAVAMHWFDLIVQTEQKSVASFLSPSPTN